MKPSERTISRGRSGQSWGEGVGLANAFVGATPREKREADLFYADLVGGRAQGAARRRIGSPRRISYESSEDIAETEPLIEGPLTDSEWRDVVGCLSRGEADTGRPLGADADRNALLIAARIFCSRNALRMDSRQEDPLLCLVGDVTMNDSRVRALVPHVVARGPIRLWHLASASDRQRYVMRLLVSTYGYPANGAAGLVGNLSAESEVIPNMVEGAHATAPMRARNFANVATTFTADEIRNRNRTTQIGPRLPGIGIAQWTSSARRTGLFQHAPTFRGVRLGAQILFDMDAQVDYLVSELRASYGRVQRVLTSPMVTVEDASDEVVYNFETPQAVLDGTNRLPRSAPGVQTLFEARRTRSRAARLLAPTS